MKKAFLTGATGFIGYNLAVELLSDGWEVRALARPRSAHLLSGLDGIQVILGDLFDLAALDSGTKGVDCVFHLAADYRLWTRDPQEMYRVNVDGTRNVLEAARKAGVPRVIHTSSVGAIKAGRDGSSADETTKTSLVDLIGDYKRSKYLGEQEALKAARDGQPVVVVCPSTPIGPHDFKPTPTGQIVVDFLNGKMFAYLASGLNLVHVRDVARGMMLAFEKGSIGERYILGNKNLSLLEIFQTLSRFSGVPAPRFRIPYPAALGVAYFSEAVSMLTRKPPFAPVNGVRMARNIMYFSAKKAVRELGMPQTPVEIALQEAAEWFCSHGHVRAGVKLTPLPAPLAKAAQRTRP